MRSTIGDLLVRVCILLGLVRDVHVEEGGLGNLFGGPTPTAIVVGDGTGPVADISATSEDSDIKIARAAGDLKTSREDLSEESESIERAAKIKKATTNAAKSVAVALAAAIVSPCD